MMGIEKLGWAIPLALVLTLASTSRAQAQEAAAEAEASTPDEEARRVFQAGSAAFESARYDEALTYFRRAFELSARPGLLYNIGVAADRLRRDAEALEAFERFLIEVEEHPRRRDVEARVVVLRQAVAERDARADEPDEQHASTSPAPVDAPSDGPGTLSIVGPIALGALGLAGIVAAIVGIGGGGQCIDGMGAGTCVEERRTNWAAVGVYGGLGVAGLAAAVVWLIVGLSGGDMADAPVAMTPRGPAMTWGL